MANRFGWRNGLRAIALGTACSFVMAPPISASTQIPRALLEEGDVIAGNTVTNIRSFDVGGHWSAIVDLEGLGLAGLLDGSPLAVPGQALANGDVPISVTSLDLDGGGGWALRYATAAFPRGRLMIDGAVVLSEGDSVDAFGVGPGATVTRLRAAVLRRPYLLVGATIEAPGAAPYDAALQFLETSPLRFDPLAMLVRTGAARAGGPPSASGTSDRRGSACSASARASRLLVERPVVPGETVHHLVTNLVGLGGEAG